MIRELSAAYRRVRKEDKGKVLDQVASLTGYNRAYAARTLRWGVSGLGRCAPRRMGTGRGCLYDGEVYDEGMTPYQEVLLSPGVHEETGPPSWIVNPYSPRRRSLPPARARIETSVGLRPQG